MNSHSYWPPFNGWATVCSNKKCDFEAMWKPGSKCLKCKKGKMKKNPNYRGTKEEWKKRC